MGKLARRNQVIKWHVILCAVVCAFIAFCAQPGSIIAADAAETVEYVDRVWNAETGKVEEITNATDEKGNILTDENGNPLPLEHECTVLTEDILEDSDGLGEHGKETWYVLNEDITYNNYQSIRIKDGANVHLILGDGVTLKATKKDAMQVYNGSSLTIYGQSGGTGKIVADGQSGHAGIGVDSTSVLTIKGGVIEAEGTQGGAGIGGNRGENAGIINIYGGTVTAEGGQYGAGIGGGGSSSGSAGSCGMVSIFGGTVTATGSKNAAGIGSGGDPNSGTDDKGIITIVGGNVTAKGGSHGAGIGGGNETTGGTISIGGGTIKAYGGRCGAGIGGGDDASSGVITIDAGDIVAEGGAEAPGIGGDSEGTKDETGFVTIHGGYIKVTGKDGAYGIGDEEVVIDIAEGVAINGVIKEGVEKTGSIDGSIAPQNREPVTYIDRTYDAETKQLVEKEKTYTGYKSLTEDICKREAGLTTGWYVLDSNITHDDYQSIRIKDGANVHLILKDGCTLTTTGKDAIQVYNGSMLTIYVQSGGTGKIVADGQEGHAGIGVDSTSALEIKGGIIEAVGTQGGAGIGGNRGEDAGIINIYGGTVTAEGGQYGAGIGGGGSSSGSAGSCGMVTIFGGTVTATGSKNAAGIGSGGDPNSGIDDQGIITIGGGDVTAYGGEHGAGIGGGNETSGNTVIIDGGKVKAYGGDCGAGIGGGDDAGAGYILINEGDIYAEGGKEAPGIGGDSEGTSDESGIVTVNDGYINAQAGEGNPYGIGDEKVIINIKQKDGLFGKVNVPTIIGTIAPQERETVEYIDREIKEDGEIEETTKTYTDCIPLTANRCKYGLGFAGGETWYVLDEDITYKKQGRVVVSGTVNLILGNDTEFDVSYNGYQQMGIYLANGATLNIYREKPTYDENGNPKPEGKIFVDGGEGKAGIRVAKGSTLNVYGGEIVAEGTTGGAGIGGDENEHAGDVNIYGGRVISEGGHKAAGIGGGGDYRGDTIGAGIGIAAATVIILLISTDFIACVFASLSVEYVYTFTTIQTIAGLTIEVTVGAAGIAGLVGGSIAVAAEPNHGGDGGTTTVYGGTLEVTGDDAPSIGGGWGKEVDGLNGTLNVKGGTIIGNDLRGANISGGNIKADSISGTDLPLHTITLEGVTEEVEVVGVNCDSYGVNNVYTLHDVIDTTKDPETGEKIDVLDNGKLYFYMPDEEYAKLTQITVKDKDGKEQVYVRDGDSDTFKKPVNITGVEAQDGIYSGLPQQGYIGMPTNEQGYAGEYDITYYNYAGEKTTPENSGAAGEGKAPVYAGNYKVKIAVSVEENTYLGYTELEFKVERATPEIVEQPKLSGYYGTSVKDMEVTSGVVEVGGIEVEGEWHVADSRGTDIPEVGTENSYEVMFLTKDFRNYKDVATMVVPEVIEIPTMSEPTLTSTSDENKQKLIEKVKGKLSDPEVKSKLSDLEVRNNIKAKVAEVREKLLSFIEE